MRTGNSGVHRQRPIDHPRSVRGSDDLRGRPIPRPIERHPAMPGPHRLPGTEYLWQITPRDPCPVTVDDALDHRAGVGEPPPRPARGTRQHLLDQRPLSIRKHLKPRHPSRLPAAAPNLCQTRPSRPSERHVHGCAADPRRPGMSERRTCRLRTWSRRRARPCLRDRSARGAVRRHL